MKYSINIEEIVNGEFEVEASSKEEAFLIAKNKYYSGEFVNEPGNITFRQMSIAGIDKDYYKWHKF